MTSPPTLDALKFGDAAAWRWVLDEFADPVRSYARRFGHPDPDEVVGATLESVARKMSTFVGGERELRAFVFSVAHARIVDELRRKRGRIEVEQHLSGARNQLVNTSDDVPIVLLGALEKLPKSQREVVHLRYIVGLSTSEAAKATGKTEEATRAILSRSLQQLREMMNAGDAGTLSTQR